MCNPAFRIPDTAVLGGGEGEGGGNDAFLGGGGAEGVKRD